MNTVTYPGGRTLDYTRDYMARMEGLSTTFGGVTQPLVSGMTYNAFGGPKGLSMSSGGEVNNQSGSSCGCIEVANPGTMMERTYTYDGNKNLTGITAPNTPWYDQSFGYDALNRLETASGSYGDITYIYDGTGNRLTRDVNGEIETYDYDVTGRNRLDEIAFSGTTEVLTFSYDANGNTTTYGDRTLIYNENNRLVEVKEGENTIATYAYNGLGQRLKKTAGGVTTYYVYDQNGQLIAETTSGNTTEYLYMGKIHMAMVDASSGDFYFYLNDRLGTPQLMTYGNTTTVMWEARYKPFGEAMVHPQSEVVNNFRLPGQYFDGETGFHYNYHRYYDPRTGRYLTPDPIGLEGGDYNIYLYASNSPIMLQDFYGLAWYDFTFLNPETSTLARQLNSIAQGMGGLLAYALGYEEAGRLAFADAVANSGHAILEESNASSCEFAAYYGALGISAISATGALIGGVAEMTSLINTSPQSNNLIRVISKPGRWGFRLDKAHHGKRWGHPHFWRW